MAVSLARQEIGFVLAKMIPSFLAILGMDMMDMIDRKGACVGWCEGNGHGISPILWIEAS